MNSGRSLRTLVPAFVFLVVGIASTVIVSYQYAVQNNQLMASSKQNLHDVMAQTQRHFEKYLLTNEFGQIREDLLVLALMEDIKLAAVISPEGDVIYSTQSELDGEIGVSAIPLYDYVISQITMSGYEYHIVESKQILQGYFPIIFAQEEHTIRPSKIGVLYVELSLETNLALMQKLFLDSIGLMLLISVIVVAAIVFMTRQWVIRPLDNLRRFTRSISRGSYPKLVSHGDLAEICALEEAFDRMSREMQDSVTELMHSEERWSFALDASGDGVADWNLAEDKVFYSARFRALLGFPEQDYEGSYSEWKTLIYEDDRYLARMALSNYFRGDSLLFQAQYRLRCCDGQLKWMSVRGRIVERDAKGAPVRLISTFEDVTQRKEMEEALKASEQKYRELFELAQEGIWVIDQSAKTTMVNASMARMLGYSRDEMLGRHLYDFMDAEAIQQYEERLKHREQGVSDEHDFRFLHKNGQPVYTSMHTSQIVGEDGDYQGAIAGVIDITQRVQAEEVIRRQALYDSLTQLPNRRFLFGRLEEELARATRHHYFGSLLFIDLDHFKNINDSLGHPVGDKLLLAIGQRVSNVIRDEDILGRLGGDEFVVLLPELHDDETIAAERARNVAQKIQQSFAEAFLIEGYNLHVSSSIGVALYPKGRDTIHDIFRQADAAMYRSKQEGRNTIRFFTNEIQVAVERKLQIQMLLPQALERKEFYLCYQPQMDRAGRLIGAEALIRWEQPELGLISPDQFIGVAEESGFIVQIGDWVLEEACRQLRIWESQGLPKDFQRIAVNISPRQFAMDRFSEETLNVVKAQGIAPNRIELELTEGMLLSDLEAVIQKMKALRDMGFHLAIDDFGTGYSSLSYLKRLPISKLKIDQSFVRDLAEDRNDRAIIETIIAITQHLELDVLAEGVETQEHLEFLASKGCFKYQGWHFGRPEKPQDFYTKWLEPESAHYSKIRSQLGDTSVKNNDADSNNIKH